MRPTKKYCFSSQDNNKQNELKDLIEEQEEDNEEMKMTADGKPDKNHS